MDADQRPLTVAWISFFPVEWLPEAPEEVRRLPRLHPATWQRVLLDELKSVASLKLHVIVLRKQFPESRAFEHEGVTFHLVKTPPGLRAPSLFWLDTVLIQRVLKNIKPDLVHAWGTENGAALVASRLGHPFIVTMQGLMSWLAETVPVNGYMKFAARLEEWSLRHARIVTVESRFAVQYLRGRYASLDLRQVEHAPARVFHQVQRRPRVEPMRFIFVSPLTHAKGGDLLLRALHRVQHEFPFELLVVGRVDEKLVQSLPPDLVEDLWPRMVFKENLTSAEVAEELATATMMIYPTRADNSPNAVKEAVVAGVPVVASGLGGILDYVTPDRNGICFAPGDVESLIEAIRAACRHPLFRQGKVDSKSLAEAREYLAPGRMGRGILEAYEAARAGNKQRQPTTDAQQ